MMIIPIIHNHRRLSINYRNYSHYYNMIPNTYSNYYIP